MDYRDYVTFEAAQVLADTGYYQQTEYKWVPLTKDLRKWRLTKNRKTIPRVGKNEYLAPSLMQARRWFLDQFGVDFSVHPVMVDTGYTHKMYTCDIYNETKCADLRQGIFDTYEESFNDAVIVLAKLFYDAR